MFLPLVEVQFVGTMRHSLPAPASPATSIVARPTRYHSLEGTGIVWLVDNIRLTQPELWPNTDQSHHLGVLWMLVGCLSGQDSLRFSDRLLNTSTHRRVSNSPGEEKFFSVQRRNPQWLVWKSPIPAVQKSLIPYRKSCVWPLPFTNL